MNNLLSRSLRLLALSLLSVLAVQAEPALLGHKSLAGQSLDAESVKAVLLGKRVMIADKRVVIVIAKTGEAQETYLKAQIGMTTSQFQNHWRRLFMTGGGSAPKIVETESDAAKLANETPGAIVIADAGKADGLAVLAR